LRRLTSRSIADANDAAQFAELETLRTIKIVYKHDVQVFIEGPGQFNAHDQRKHGKQLEYCDEAPFYTLVTINYRDIARGMTTLPLPSEPQ
jgi:thiamine biosynthesis protein ThiC